MKKILFGGFILNHEKNFWQVLFNFLVEPGVLFVFVFTSLVLLFCNFLPLPLKKAFGFYDFLMKYNVWIFVIFLISFFLLLYMYRRDRIHAPKDDIVRKLVYEDDCWRILLKLYDANGVPVNLSYDEPGVESLVEHGLITQSSNEMFYGRQLGYVFDYPYLCYYLFDLSSSAKRYIDERLDNERKQSMNKESN